MFLCISLKYSFITFRHKSDPFACGTACLTLWFYHLTLYLPPKFIVHLSLCVKYLLWILQFLFIFVFMFLRALLFVSIGYDKKKKRHFGLLLPFLVFDIFRSCVTVVNSNTTSKQQQERKLKHVMMTNDLLLTWNKALLFLLSYKCASWNIFTRDDKNNKETTNLILNDKYNNIIFVDVHRLYKWSNYYEADKHSFFSL